MRADTSARAGGLNSLIDRVACGVEPERLHLPRLRGHGGGLADQVALAEVDPEVAEHREVGPPLDALGKEPSTDPAAERDEGLHEGLLGVVAGDADAISRSILMTDGRSAAIRVKLA